MIHVHIVELSEFIKPPTTRRLDLRSSRKSGTCGKFPPQQHPQSAQYQPRSILHMKSHNNPGGLTPEQKRRAEQFTSIFENDTIVLQYDYAENIGDGRGFTCGRAGFTTATGDALLVVERYTQTVPANGLAKYQPELQRLAEDEDGDTSTIQGFDLDWQKAAQDPAFRDVQDAVVDEIYYQPSVQCADAAGLKTALARAVLYDTIIQHGEGDDPDGLPALLQRTQKKVHGTPKTGIDEKIWLQAFLKIRRNNLLHPANPDTQEEWAQSVDRCDAFSAIATAGNYDLHGPIHIHNPKPRCDRPLMIHYKMTNCSNVVSPFRSIPNFTLTLMPRNYSTSPPTCGIPL